MIASIALWALIGFGLGFKLRVFGLMAATAFAGLTTAVLLAALGSSAMHLLIGFAATAAAFQLAAFASMTARHLLGRADLPLTAADRRRARDAEDKRVQAPVDDRFLRNGTQGS